MRTGSRGGGDRAPVQNAILKTLEEPAPGVVISDIVLELRVGGTLTGELFGVLHARHSSGLQRELR